MNLLLLGGSGFVSGHLTRAALEAGHRVTVITRGKRPLPSGVESIVADRKDRGGFARALREYAESLRAGGTQLFDLAVDGIGFDADDARQDVELLCPLARAFVFVSTDFVYDSTASRPTGPLDETYARFETRVPYGAGKRAAEELILSSSGNAACHRTVLRPCHIYGSGSLLGCLPEHGRDPQLIDRLRRREPLTLVTAGRLLQQPVYAPDLARMILSCADNPAVDRQIFHAAGPEVVRSIDYYRIIAESLGVPLEVRDRPIEHFLSEHPDKRPFCQDRVYAMAKAQAAGLAVPSTPLAVGLRCHVESML